MAWTVETLNDAVDSKLRALSPDVRAWFARIYELIAAVELERIGAPHVRHLTEPLWDSPLPAQ